MIDKKEEIEYVNVNKKYHQKFNLSDYLVSYYSHDEYLYQQIGAHYEAKKIFKYAINAKKILLIGCGFGRELDLILKLNPLCKVYVMDVNKNFINSLEKVYNKNRVEFCQQDFNDNANLVYDSNFFDFVIALNTLEYVISDYKYKNILAEISRILMPNGIFYTRFLNSNNIFGVVSNFLISRRRKDTTRYVLRNYGEFKAVISHHFKITHEDSLDYSFNIPILRFFYKNYFAYTSYKLGLIVAKLVGINNSPFIYLVLKK
jgi:ubiquinone/menaquinone biosynthesis C-methylase UbiE